MSAADWTFEERLHERIDARRLIATRLSPRQRRVLCRTYLHGETLREIAAPDGVSPARVAQILAVALQRLQRPPQALPRPAPATAPAPPGFDRTAFLHHMQGLITRRIVEDSNRRERERQNLDAIMRREEAQGLFEPPAPPKPAPPPKPYAPTIYWAPAPRPPPTQNVEPWFDPARQPTLEDLRCIAQYTLGYFTSAAGLVRDGSSEVGSHTMRVLCPRDADAIAEAMQRVRAAMPSSHRLSACLLDTPPELLCVALGNRRVALRVSSIEDGRRVAIEVTHGPVTHGPG